MESVGQMIGYDIDEEFEFDPSLVLYLPLWKLDGQSFKSEDAYGRLCTVTGATWGSEGRTFNGDDFINTTYIPASLTEVTIGAWVKLASDTNFDTIIGGLDADSLLTLGFDAGNKVRFRADNPGTVSILSDTALTFGVRYFILGRITSAKVMSLWINGVLQSATATCLTIRSDVALYLGARNNAGVAESFLDGTIREALIYSRASSAVEIQQIYNANRWRYG